ncbi:unnamed protein product, partial [Bubo scandiacus]
QEFLLRACPGTTPPLGPSLPTHLGTHPGAVLSPPIPGAAPWDLSPSPPRPRAPGTAASSAPRCPAQRSARPAPRRRAASCPPPAPPRDSRGAPDPAGPALPGPAREKFKKCEGNWSASSRQVPCGRKGCSGKHSPQHLCFLFWVRPFCSLEQRGLSGWPLGQCAAGLCRQQGRCPPALGDAAGHGSWGHQWL